MYSCTTTVIFYTCIRIWVISLETKFRYYPVSEISSKLNFKTKFSTTCTREKCIYSCVIWPQNTPSAERSLDGWVTAFGLLGYRITAHDGHLAPRDGTRQAIAPVGVSPRRFLAVSDLGAFCFTSVVSPNRKPPNRHNFAEKLV
jgi:hypothetical protein